MPTLTGIGLAITIDVLMRVSLVLTAGLILAHAARKHAALRHAILVAGLAAAFVVPAAMLIMQLLPVSRLQLGLLVRSGLDDSAEAAMVNSRPGNELQHRPTVVPSKSDETRRDPHHDPSARSENASFVLRAPSCWDLPYARSTASAFLSTLMFGAIVKLTGLGLSLVRLRGLVARARPVTGDQLMPILDLVQRQIPMPLPPRLLECAEVFAPVATGVIGNYVLLPAGWAGRASRDEILAVLCHECAHLARCDHRVVILQELLASALWFHPLVHLFNRDLNRVREEMCDNHAIAVVDRASYCEALLLLAVGRSWASPRGATPMWSVACSLEDRVRGILDERRPTTTGISRVARSATAASALAFCGLIAMPRMIGSPPNDPIAAAPEAESSPRAKVGPISNEMTRSIIRSFPAHGDETLRFENLAGRVEIVPGNGPRLEVEATVRVSELSEAELKRLIDAIRWIEVPAEEGSTHWGLSFPADAYPTVRYPVEGETKTKLDTIRYLNQEIRLPNRKGAAIPGIEFDLRIAVPPNVRLEVQNAVGPIDADSVASPLILSTRHGAIKLGNVRARIDATSEFGDVLLSRLNADAIVRTGSGDIELSRIAQGHVTLSTRSGRCRIVRPPEAGFRLHYSGARPIDVIGGGVARLSSREGGREMELLSSGTGGPSITISSDTGDTVIETGP